MPTWKDKVVVVTGGSKGLGRAIAVAFARAGANTVIMARDAETLRTTLQESESQWQDDEHDPENSFRMSSVCVDVTSDESVQSAISEVIQQHGQIDVWVNNVGKSIRTDIRTATLDQYRDLMELNFYSAVRCSQLVLGHLEESSGHLINIGSLSSKTAWPLVAPYTTSKFALAAYTAQLRLEGPSSCLLYTSPSPRDATLSRMPSSA